MSRGVSDDAVLELMTIGDVALFVGVSGDAVRIAADAGRLRVAAKTPSGMRLFSISEVQRFKHDREAARERRER